MSEFLKKPQLRRGVTVQRGDKLREGQSVEMHLTPPLASNAEVPPKTVEMEEVEKADPKILDAKERKKEQAERAASRGTGKRRGGSSTTGRPPKQSRRAEDVVVDVDSGETIPAPTPIRSVPAPGSAGQEEGGSRDAGIHLSFRPYFGTLGFFC